ncbi:putative 2-oxoglutarate-dependent dioxygenase DIN11 isoform X2 [Balamuthia mandrillaris]
MYLSHFTSPSLKEVEEMFRLSADFFSLPSSAKQRLAYPSTEKNVGYISVARERLNPDENRAGDLKEAFNTSHHSDMSSFWLQQQNAERKAGEEDNKEREEQVEELKRMTKEFFERCEVLARKVLKIFALALGLERGDFFEDVLTEHRHTLRMLHYPPLTEEEATKAIAAGQTRAGEHDDYGCITLLFQDDVGGLQVRDANGNWMAAPCIPNTVLVNTGGLMQHWTNGKFKSTKHRVVIPEEPEQSGRDRYSIAFFVHPNDDTVIVPFPSCLDDSNSSSASSAITAGQYLAMRLKRSY